MEKSASSLVELHPIVAQRWSPRSFDDGSARTTAQYDAGLASSLLTVEAHHRGLAVHQIGGFDHEGLAKSLNLDESLQTIVVLAIGKTAPADLLPNETLRQREVAERTRLPLPEIVLAGAPRFELAFD